MTLMADWTDGPEYAPSARPDAFVPPQVEPFADAGAPPTAERAPAEQPEFTGSADAVPLERLVASSGPERDPLEMFTVVTTPLATLPDVPSQPGATQPLALSTAPGYGDQHAAPVMGSQGSAWGAAHAPSAQPRTHDGWAPQQPMALPDLPAPEPMPGGYPQHLAVNPQGFPTGADATWYAANPGYTGPPGPRQVTARALIDAADPLVLGSLAAGAVLPFVGLAWLAPALLLLASVLAGQRIRYRRRAVRNTFAAATTISMVLATLAAIEDYSPSLWAFWDSLCGWSQLSCWVVPAIIVPLVWSALRRGEAPTP